MQTALNILMIGWEFPPHNSGGLGTACHGLALGCKAVGGMNLTFVLPALLGAEDHGCATLLAAPAGTVGLRPGMDGKAALPNPYGGDLLDAAQAYGERVPELLQQRRCEFDLIHAHDWLTAAAGIKLKKISGKPLVLHIHSTEFDRAGEQADPRIVKIEWQAMHSADLVVAVSAFTRRLLIERYALPAHKVRMVYNGIASASQACTPPSRRTGKTVAFLGRITQQKGPAYFLHAAARALAQDPELLFIMAGDGDMLPAMQALARALAIDERVAFPGFLRGDEVHHLLAQSDVFVMPSVSEPFGIAALEAIKAGVPAVVSRQSGVVELFAHMAKVDHWDVAAMAGEMVRLANDSAYASTMREGALRELESVDWARSARTLRTCYRELLSESSASPRAA